MELAPQYVIPVGDGRFDIEVLGSTIPVLVHFGAPWSPLCPRHVTPHIDKLARECRGFYKFVWVNLDESTFTARKYSIRSVPTLMVFKGGVNVAYHAGVLQSELHLRMLLRI